MKEFTLIELGKRLGQLLLSLFVLLVVTFVIGRILPTDPVGAIVGELADPAAYEAMRARLGLDLPVTSSSGCTSPRSCTAISERRS